MSTTNLFDLTGKVALVSGGSSGLGFQFAKVFAAHGADIALVARRTTRLEENKKIIEDMGVKCHTHFVDLLNYTSIDKCVENVVDHYGRVDILMNAAGVRGVGSGAEQTNEEWLSVIDADLNGQYFMTRGVARLAMIPQKYGKVINILSIHAFVGRIGLSTGSYCAAKGGMLTLTKALGNEWAKHNITVNAIAPGYFPSEITARYIDTEAFKRTCETYCPFGRPGKTGELDGIAVYFASDASSYTTGQVVSVDGGWLTV
jgi:gluconate 5-dehydrogenase